MDAIQNDWFLMIVILPVIIGFFKKEIGDFLTAWKAYRLRSFDADGNPNTSDRVQILCGATGTWVDAIILKHVFSLSPKKRGVYIMYPDGGREKIGWLVWITLRKRTHPNDVG